MKKLLRLVYLTSLTLLSYGLMSLRQYHLGAGEYALANWCGLMSGLVLVIFALQIVFMVAYSTPGYDKE